MTKDLALDKTEQYSFCSKIYQLLRDDILSGKYRNDEELRENTIAKVYGVSRTPVREAIRQLSREGLVTIIPNRGAYVKTIKKKDIEDIYAIRSMLEGLCARWVAENASEEQCEKVEEILYMAKYHYDHGHQDQFYKYDGKFHEALYEACNSSILSNILTRFHEYVQVVRRYSLGNAARAEKSLEEHNDIFEAIKERNGDKAAALAELHIKKAVENFKKIHFENIISK